MCLTDESIFPQSALQAVYVNSTRILCHRLLSAGCPRDFVRSRKHLRSGRDSAMLRHVSSRLLPFFSDRAVRLYLILLRGISISMTKYWKKSCYPLEQGSCNTAREERSRSARNSMSHMRSTKRHDERVVDDQKLELARVGAESSDRMEEVSW